MSISRNIYELADRVQKFVNRKSFKVAFVGFSTFFLFLNVFNVYAEEGTKISPDWDGTKKFHNVISGAQDDEDNMNSREGLEILNTMWSGISLMAPEITENGDKVAQSEGIPYDLKRGLLGMAEDAGDTAYALYPTADVPSHLAQMWVPGYDESVSSAYAADEDGYTSLRNAGIVGLWSKFLNISYVVFVIIMIAAGFMIMFRHKLGGQTMVTIGNVLPNVIISLLLATFSFAIAGLIIDFGGLLVSLIADIYAGEQVGISGITELMGAALSGSPEKVANLTGGAGVGLLGLGTLASSAGILLALSPFAVALGAVGAGVFLIILGVIFVGAVKVVLALYKAYFTLLINVIIAPIQITMGAIPGNGNMIKNWFLSILRNVLVFPMVFAIVNLPNAIISENPDAILNFPNKLVSSDGGWDINATGGLFLFILKIFVLYFAAQAPKFLEAWFPPDTNKALAEGIGNANASLSKIPFLGGLFK